jgi:hypothetical protein
VRRVVHHQVEWPPLEVLVDDTTELEPVRLVHPVVHVHPIAETVSRDQFVERGHSLLVELHRHEDGGVTGQGHEGATTALVDAQLDDRGGFQLGQQVEIGHDDIGPLDHAEPFGDRLEAVGRPSGYKPHAVQVKLVLCLPRHRRHSNQLFRMMSRKAPYSPVRAASV